ncbi:hypothetical protein M514_01941 [Trichuris suis]|uniref:Uncharacterized protein n=1 Tax=Trichuris suis TaxID=68888 RepID=A0A085MIL0_9BILA|nr:hypothetical protein M513_01941 [Trichuris suis]KFD69576.1 hypothetical protein M514_01941 [Trichuris suis]
MPQLKEQLVVFLEEIQCFAAYGLTQGTGGQMNAEQQNAVGINLTPGNGQSANEESRRTVTYLQKILEVCSQQSVLTWKEAFPGR